MIGADRGTSENHVHEWNDRAFAIELGSRVTEARHSKGLTQKKLATRSGLHRSTISALENGTRKTEVVTLFLAAGALGMSPSELLVGIEKAVRDRLRTSRW
jgi:transcriptional regulator with XRE-family HTH domain